MYTSDRFINFVRQLRFAQTPNDVFTAWMALDGHYNNLRVVTALPNYHKTISFPGMDIRNLFGRKIIKPYFLHDSLYFIDRNSVNLTITEQIVNIPLDGSIMLDTNIASYISTYIYRGNFGASQQEIVHLLHQILRNNPNYDYIYYLIENSKNFLHSIDTEEIPDKDTFWSSLHPNFKKNLTALRLFFSIDNTEFNRTNNDSPKLTETEAESEAKEYVYQTYYGSNSRDILDDVRFRLLIAKILLYKVIAINFSSREGIKKKARKYFRFMMEKLGTYFDREMHVGLKYFREGRSFSFFEKIDKGKQIDLCGVAEKVENMAWDLMVPRVIESLSAVLGRGKYFIPYFLTWDSGLNKALDVYQAKACIFDDSLGRVLTIPAFDVESELRDTVGQDDLDRFFSPSEVAARQQRPKKSYQDLEDLLHEVRSECFMALHA